MKMFIWGAVWSGLLLLGTGTHAQMHRGTIVLADISQSRAIIAADSRSSEEGRSPNDHHCKIAALGKQMLFAASGIVSSHHTLLVSLNWDAYADAVKTFEQVREGRASSGGLVTSVSADWEHQIKIHFATDERRDLQGLLKSATTDSLLDSMFVGLDDRGGIEAREVSFTFDRAQATKSGFSTVISSNKSLGVSTQMVLKAMGHTEVAQEFAYQSSPRAKMQAQLWALDQPNHGNEDPDVLYLKRLIGLEITYGAPEEGVGGETDIAILDSSAGVHWIARKTNCPEDATRVIAGKRAD